MFRCNAIKEARNDAWKKLVSEVGTWVQELSETDRGILAAGRFPQKIWGLMDRKEKEGSAHRRPGERDVLWRARVQNAFATWGEGMEQIRKSKGDYGWWFAKKEAGMDTTCDACGQKGECYLQEDGEVVCASCLVKEREDAEGEGCSRCGKLGPSGVCEECKQWERYLQEQKEEGEVVEECMICGEHTGGQLVCDECRSTWQIATDLGELAESKGTGGATGDSTGAAEQKQGGRGDGGLGRKRGREEDREERAMGLALANSRADERARHERARPHKLRLQRRVSREGKQIIDVMGDGNCFFHVMVRQAEQFGVVMTHQELRSKVCQFFEDNRRTKLGDTELESFVTGKWEDFIGRLRRNAWGEDIVIRAAATILKVEIVVISSIESMEEPTRLRPLVGRPADGKRVMLGHLDIPGQEHFVSVE